MTRRNRTDEDNMTLEEAEAYVDELNRRLKAAGSEVRLSIKSQERKGRKGKIRRWDDIVMAGPDGKHAVGVTVSSPVRLFAHLHGFCKYPEPCLQVVEEVYEWRPQTFKQDAQGRTVLDHALDAWADRQRVAELRTPQPARRRRLAPLPPSEDPTVEHYGNVQDALETLRHQPLPPMVATSPYGACKRCAVCLRFDVYEGCCTVCGDPLERVLNPPKGYRLVNRDTRKLKRRLMR